VRPFGAIIFGRIGDLVGRKYTFLVTIVVMGGATFLVGLLPTFSSIGWLAPILLVTLRLAKVSPLAANTAAPRRMWRSTQDRTSAVMQQATFRLRRHSASSCAAGDRAQPHLHGRQMFAEWGWRIPFWISLSCWCSRSTSGSN